MLTTLLARLPLLVLVAITLGSSASPAFAIPPALVGTQDEPLLIEHEIVTYKQAGESELRLHVWKPAVSVVRGREQELRPAIVFFFGGGWKSGRIQQFAPHCQRLAAEGFVAFSAEYRVETRHGTTPFACVRDGKSAVRWIRGNATEYGIDPDRIFAGGGSAGGHVAACTALVEGENEESDDLSISCSPNKLVLFNPVIDTGPKGYGMQRLGERWKELSPLHLVRAELPPTLIFHGTADKTVTYDRVEAFRSAMREQGNVCTLIGFVGAGHGFFNEGRGDGTDYEETLVETLRFLR